MAKPNYAFEKRQKELAKKQKKQEKLLQRKSCENHQADDADSEMETETESGTENAAEGSADPIPTSTTS